MLQFNIIESSPRSILFHFHFRVNNLFLKKLHYGLTCYYFHEVRYKRDYFVRVLFIHEVHWKVATCDKTYVLLL